MIGLLENRLVPVTDTIGFLQCPAEVAKSTFLDWQRPLQEPRGTLLHEQRVAGSLEAILRRLLPLTSVEARRFLFIPTQTDWTAFFDNGHQGTDAFAPISYLAKEIGCVGIRATDALPGRTQGGTVFELYSPEDTDWLNVVRSISAAPTDGRWAFSASGTTLSFEAVEFYAKKRIKDRLNSEILKQYLEEFAIDAFNPDFYAKEGFLIEKVGTCAPAMQLFGLAD